MHSIKLSGIQNVTYELRHKDFSYLFLSVNNNYNIFDYY